MTQSTDKPTLAMRFSALTLALATGLSLSACISWSPPRALLADDLRSRDVVPDAWSAATPPASATTGSIVEWWERFHDPLLSTLVQQALQANTDVRAARAALYEARALRDVEAATSLPSMDAYTSGQRSRSITQSGTGAATTQTYYETGLDATWELDFFGANRSALRAAEEDARASAASLADMQVSIAAEVALAYIQLRGDQLRLNIARENLTSQLKTLQITKWRRQAGLTSSLDVEQARATSEQTRANIPALEVSIAQTEHSLAVLSGQPPGHLKELSQVTNAVVPAPADDLAVSLPAQTLRQRADVRATEHKVSAAKALVSQAEAERYPSFSLSGSVGLQALTLDALTGGASTVSSLLASVSMPVFSGGANRARIRAQEAALGQAWMNHEAQVLAALQEVEDALVALKGDRERLVSLRHAAEAAGNAALLASQRYTGGLIDFQTVLETQRTLLDTQDGVASTTADVSKDYVRLYKALGGGWQPDSTRVDPWTP